MVSVKEQIALKQAKSKQVVALREEGKSFSEIATILGLASVTVSEYYDRETSDRPLHDLPEKVVKCLRGDDAIRFLSNGQPDPEVVYRIWSAPPFIKTPEGSMRNPDPNGSPYFMRSGMGHKRMNLLKRWLRTHGYEIS